MESCIQSDMLDLRKKSSDLRYGAGSENPGDVFIMSSGADYC